MFDLKTFQQKSPQQRFLFILGLVMFTVYLILGLVLIFWTDMPITLDKPYRIALGVLLIVYAAIRFNRVMKPNND